MKAFSKKTGRIFAAAGAVIMACGAVAGASVSFASETHTHNFSKDWGYDSKNHYHAATCCGNLITDVAAHEISGGECKVCDYKTPEEQHVHTFSDTWSKDEVNHWRASTCNDDVIRDAAAHNYSGNICLDCSYEKPSPAHSHTYSAGWGYDSKNHWHPSDCGHENIVKGVEAHTLKDGECTCGYTTQNSGLKIVTGAYAEGLYAEWVSDSVSDVSVSYQLKGDTAWTAIDSELIRKTSGGKVRADALGLKAGTYNLKVTSGKETVTKNDIAVTAQDRSGYAHFGTTDGVGAYNNDGVPKNNAQIIYVSEATKNTVKATIGGKEYEGLVNILTATPNAKIPVIIRIIGRISAYTWNYLDAASGTDCATALDNLKKTYDYKNASSNIKVSQEELISKGYNTLNKNIAGVTENLNNLPSNMIIEKGTGELDSCWNDCSIGGSSSTAENITVEGVGVDAELFQWGMTWRYAKSVEIKNLTFDDYTEDACSFEGDTADVSKSKRIWLHNCTFNEGMNYWDVCGEQDKHEGDGGTDFKGVSNVTISYNHYNKTHKTGLIGGGNSHLTSNITFHHNYYEDCKSRLPLARQANMHMYNNYYCNSGTSVSLRAYAYALIEYCYFSGDNNTMIDIQSYSSSTEKSYGVAKVYECFMGGKNYSYQSVPSSEKPSGLTSATSTKAYEPFIFIVSDRAQKVTNYNSFSKDFDTNESVFYYDAANKRSKVTDLITDVSTIPEIIPKLAGAMK